MKKIFFLSVLFAFCGPKKTQKAYVNELSGIELFRKEPKTNWPDEPATIRAPFLAEIEVEVTSEKRLWYKTKFNNEFFWVSAKDVSFNRTTKYYMIVTRDGLNLRKEPNNKSHILSVIPFEAKGLITAVNPRTEDIQHRRGFWLEVEYGNKKGWVFSGFVLTGNSKDELKLEKISLKRDPIDLREAISPPQNSVSFFDGKGIAYETPSPDCYTSTASKLGHILINHEGKFLGLLQEPEREFKIKTEPEIKSHIITQAHFCICCCGNASDLIYLFPKGKSPIAFPLHFERYPAYCAGEETSPSNETRISKDLSKIYIHKKMPICEGTYAENASFSSEASVAKMDYKSGAFKIIDLLNNSVEQIDTIEIPKDYLPVWNDSTVMKIRN